MLKFIKSFNSKIYKHSKIYNPGIITFIYNKDVTISICNEDLSWHTFGFIEFPKQGNYIRKGNTFYLTYEEPCFYK